MWQIKTFKTLADQELWIVRNEGRYWIVRLFVNNGFAVEYRKLRMI